MDGLGYDVVMEVSELWTVRELPVGQGTGGPDDMVPRLKVMGWKATPVVGTSGEIVHYVVGDPLTDHEEDGLGTIPVGLVYDTFFPTRDQAVDAIVRRHISERIEGLRAAMNLALTQLRAELLELSKGQ